MIAECLPDIVQVIARLWQTSSNPAEADSRRLERSVWEAALSVQFTSEEQCSNF
jgi:hypothetical protein